MPLLAAAASVLSTTPVHADLGDQLFKLTADDGAEMDFFGFSVAISGSTAVIGAFQDDDNGNHSGSGYLFDITTGDQIGKLVPDDNAAGDRFGISVAMSGTTAIVGAHTDDDNGESSGSAYLFDTTTGQQIAKIIPNDGAAEDGFGASIGISGAIAIVGAPGDDDNGSGSGAAYLFDISDRKNPVQIAKLLADDGAELDRFGISVAISGNTAIVGAFLDDVHDDDSGSAYLFDVTTGVQIAKLLPSGGAGSQYFGHSVAISGEIAIVGADWDNENGAQTGAAYLFDIGTGQQIAKFFANDGTPADYFGSSVAINGATAIVGAEGDDDGGLAVGSAYVFDISEPTNPIQIAKLLPDLGAESPQFGRSVAISGTTAISGAPGDDGNFIDSGSAYLFDVGQGSSPAALTSCSITFGTTDNPPCDVANLNDDDDIDQILRSQFGFSAFERNLTEIVIEGNGADATTMASIATRDGSDTTNVVAKVKARNYTTNSINDITQYDVSFPITDTPHNTIVNSADFVDVNGDIEVRLRYVAPATFTPLGFSVGLDQMEVMVE